MNDLIPSTAALLDAYLEPLAEGGRPGVRNALRRVGEYLAEQGLGSFLDIQPKHIRPLQHHLQTTYAPSTAAAYFSCTMGILSAAERHDVYDTQRLARCRAAAQRMDDAPVRPKRFLQPDDMRRMIESCADDWVGERDRCILALLSVGLRRVEIQRLQLGHIQQGTLVVVGKGLRVRQIPLLNGLADAVSRWLAIRGDAPGPLFYAAAKKVSHREPRPLSLRAISDIVERAAQRAGLKAASHDFRRGFISTALADGADVFALGAVTGHRSPAGLLPYDVRSDDAKLQILADSLARVLG